MAYNPFNIFRRNQKAIFAVITVFIMFTFVLSSGLGGGADFFDWLPQWLSTKTRKGDHLCTIDGSKIYTREVEDVRRKRIMANRFMSYASTEAIMNLQRYADSKLGEVSPNIRPQLSFAMQLALSSPQYLGDVERMLGPNPRQADRDVARTIQLMASFAARRMMGPDHYFVNLPNRSTRDAVEFLLWEKKADQLGIRFTEADVKHLIRREFLDQFKDDASVRKEMARMPGFTLSAALKAIGDEFRVRAAQSVVLGNLVDGAGRGDRTLTAPPVFTPPYELFDFYREKASPTAYQVLAVPVPNFADLVPTPSDDDPKFRAELQELYNKHRDQEPNPAVETPGFKLPRQVKVEWVQGNGSEPYYQTAAKEWMSKGEVQAKAGALLTVPLGPIGPAWAAAAAAPLAARDPLVHSEYESGMEFRPGVVERHRSKVRNEYFSPSVFPRDVLDTSVVRPANLVAAVGGMAGGLITHAPPAAAFAPVIGGTIAHEQRDRIRAGVPALFAAIPGPGRLATTVAAEAAYRANLPKPLPIEVVRPTLLSNLAESKARLLMVTDFQKLKADVDKLMDESRKTRKEAEGRVKAKALVDEFVKTRGLARGESARLQSEWTIDEDPGLAPLKAVLTRSPPGNQPVRFGQQFFWATNPETRSRSATAGLFRPEFYPDARPNPQVGPFDKPDPVFLTWRTEEKATQAVAFNSAFPQVKEAWKEIKARDMARAEAEAIAAKIQATNATSYTQVEMELRDLAKTLEDKFPDPKAKERVRKFPLLNVAELAPVSDPRLAGMGGGLGEQLQRFQLAPSNDIPYPTREMEKALLDERAKPVRTAVVLADQPKDTYYVAVVAQRSEKGFEEFERNVYSQLGSARQAVLAAHFTEAIRRTQQSVLALLKQEFKYAEDEEQKKKLDKADKEGID